MDRAYSTPSSFDLSSPGINTRAKEIRAYSTFLSSNFNLHFFGFFTNYFLTYMEQNNDLCQIPTLKSMYKQSLLLSIEMLNYILIGEKNMFGIIGNIINQEGCKTILINGVHDHVHCFFILKPSMSISKIVQLIKGNSSKWINDQKLTSTKFSWQSGYGAFTYGQSQVNDVVKYIQNQESHHKKKTFREEYLMLLEKFEIEYNETYVFKDPI